MNEYFDHLKFDILSYQDLDCHNFYSKNLKSIGIVFDNNQEVLTGDVSGVPSDPKTS